MPYGLPASVLGLIVSGDLGPSTIYTDRFGHKVEFPKSPPKEPPSPGQQYHRERFRIAQRGYMALTPAIKAKWEDITRKVSLCMTGQNLYIHVAMKADYDYLDTLCHQSGITVPPPDSV
jgi:hypothetical protein